MGRNILAARSLRHLRFARRMLVSQPLLARAAEGVHPGYQPVYVTPDGRRLPLGHIVRRAPRDDMPWLSDLTAPAPLVTGDVPAETGLRLLPPLTESGERDAFANATPDTPHRDADPTTLAPVAERDRSHPSDTATAEAPVIPRPEPALPVVHEGRRPRARIVELPGILIQPIEPEPDEDGQGNATGLAPDIPADTTANPAADTLPDEQVGRTLTQDIPSPAPQPDAESPDTAPRRDGKRAVQRPRASDALFPPTDGDRSPQAWLARLQQGQQPSQAAAKPNAKPGARTFDEQPPARGSTPGTRRSKQSPRAEAQSAQSAEAAPSPRPEKPSRAVEQPAPVAVTSRALLLEATGVDPNSANIYRGTAAARVTSGQNADALTDGVSIALGAGHATDTPETLGLLAHELTHVAQRRAPRFVPPAALAASAPARPLPGQPPLADDEPRASHDESLQQPLAPPVTSPASPADEEAQATLVESRVTHGARARQSVSFSAPVAPPGSPARQRRPSPTETRPVWGNLPAPWEPLPDWLTVTDGAPGTAPEGRQPARPAPAIPPSASALSASTSSAPGGTLSRSATAPGTQRAERGRATPSPASEMAHSATAHEGVAPEPDLDALAQQVHAILKRRLAAERRRFG